MAKSKIIKELANKEISLEVAFNRLLIIASDIENNDLIEWATNELNGYPDDNQPPDYRKGKMGHLVYSGINGRLKVTNHPLPLSSIDKNLINLLQIDYFRQDIATIEKFALYDDNCPSLDLTELSGNVYKNTGIQCLSISMQFPKEVFLRILSSVRTKLLKVFIELDKNLGCLDGLDFDTTTEGAEELNQKIRVIIYKDNSITIGDNNELKNNVFQKLGGKNNGN